MLETDGRKEQRWIRQIPSGQQPRAERSGRIQIRYLYYYYPDKTFLVVTRLGASDTLRDKVVKVVEPFSNKLWILLVFVILVAAQFWFANDQSELYRNKSERKIIYGAKTNPCEKYKGSGCHVCPGCFPRKGVNFFFPVGVNNDAATRLPNYFLMFGLGCSILITVSAYVANFAAFLTRNVGEIKTI